MKQSTVLSAWAKINRNDLPDMVSLMIYQDTNQRSEWVHVDVETGYQSGSKPFRPTPSNDEALVQFELPGDMPCTSPDSPEELTTLEAFINSNGNSKMPAKSVLVPCLPAVFASRVIFQDPISLRSAESNLRRFLPDKGGWLNLEAEAFEPESTRTSNRSSLERPNLHIAPRTLEKVAASIATATRLGFTDLKKDRRVTFDVGTSALLRQLLDRNPESPDPKKTVADCKAILNLVFNLAKENGISPGTLPRSWKDEKAGARELSSIIKEFTFSEIAPPGDFFPKNSSRIESPPVSADQLVTKFVLRSLLNSDQSPGIKDIRSIISDASKEVSAVFNSGDPKIVQVRAGLEALERNVESAEDRIDNFREQYAEFDGLVGLAYVFWGWSDEPLKNFQHRIKPLRNESLRAYQVSNFIYAAACGSEKISVGFLSDPNWNSAYRLAWKLLLAAPDPSRKSTPSKDLWKVAALDVTPDLNGQKIAVVLDYDLTVSLRIQDPMLAAIGFINQCLQLDHAKATIASAILSAVDQSNIELPATLRKLCTVSVKIAFRKDAEIKFDGRNLIFDDMQDSDVQQFYKWSDPSLAADKLSNPKLLTSILNSLPESAVELLKNSAISLSHDKPHRNQD